MPFIGEVNLKTVPKGQRRDPPFRRLDFRDEAPVLSMAAQLRRAWHAVPRVESVWSSDEDTQQEAVGLQKARILSVRASMSEDLVRSEEERKSAPKNEDLDPETPWRTTIYYMWLDIIPVTGHFLGRASGTCGHWHQELVDQDPEEAFGHLVLRWGQTDEKAMRVAFANNVLVVPAFIRDGVSVNLFRLPMGEEGDEYVLPTNEGLSGIDNTDETTIWFLRRDVPLELHIEPSDGSTESFTEGDIAAVLVYANLCVDNHDEEEVEGDDEGGDEVDGEGDDEGDGEGDDNAKDGGEDDKKDNRDGEGENEENGEENTAEGGKESEVEMIALYGN